MPILKKPFINQDFEDAINNAVVENACLKLKRQKDEFIKFINCEYEQLKVSKAAFISNRIWGAILLARNINLITVDEATEYILELEKY